MTAMPPEPDCDPQQRPDPPPALQASALPPPTAEPGRPVADPAVAATVRLLHRRQGWRRTAVTGFFAFLLAYGAYANAQSQGAPAPSWFADIIIALGALTFVGIVAAVADTVLLRRRPPAVRAQAAPIAAHHPRRPQAHHYPPRHWVPWIFGWIGMLLILLVAVVSVPAVFDGVAYLAGAENTVTFDPVSYQTNCDQYSCQTSTDGILETGGAGVAASWPDVVPLGRPLQVREPMWSWGLGGALIDSDGIAVGAVLISLLIEGAAVLVTIRLVKLARNWVRHRAVESGLPAQAGGLAGGGAGSGQAGGGSGGGGTGHRGG
jgi:hypothetical protein